MSNPKTWREASARAIARLDARTYSDSDEHAPGYKLADILNKLRDLGELPETTSSFQSARARTTWRTKAEQLRSELDDAIGAYSTKYELTRDEIGAQIAEALEGGDQIVFHVPDESDQLDVEGAPDELSDVDTDTLSDPDAPATMADADAHFNDDNGADPGAETEQDR